MNSSYWTSLAFSKKKKVIWLKKETKWWCCVVLFPVKLYPAADEFESRDGEILNWKFMRKFMLASIGSHSFSNFDQNHYHLENANSSISKLHCCDWEEKAENAQIEGPSTNQPINPSFASVSMPANQHFVSLISNS